MYFMRVQDRVWHRGKYSSDIFRIVSLSTVLVIRMARQAEYFHATNYGCYCFHTPADILGCFPRPEAFLGKGKSQRAVDQGIAGWGIAALTHGTNANEGVIDGFADLLVGWNLRVWAIEKLSDGGEADFKHAF
jgi:hypothetical protein